MHYNGDRCNELKIGNQCNTVQVKKCGRVGSYTLYLLRPIFEYNIFLIRGYLFCYCDSNRHFTAGEIVKEPILLWGRDFSPVNNVPLHGTLGLKSKLQNQKSASSFTVSGAVE